MKRFDTYSPVHGRPFVLWIAALVPHKSPLEMVEIAKALPAIDFVMIGSPWDTSILDQLMKEKTDNVHYLGPVSDRMKIDLIRQSSAGITTSKYEGFGWTPFEFLTAGKPVLAYPLGVFREIYGDLIIYADNVAAFIKQLTELHRRAFKSEIDSGEIAQLQRRWSLASAVARIVKLLDLKSLVIFTRDWPVDSNMILGSDVMNWKLWRSISDAGIQLQIFANGTRYSTQFNVGSRTVRVGQRLAFLRRTRSAMSKSSWAGADSVRSALEGTNRVTAIVFDLILQVFEPICYLFEYVKKGDRTYSYVFASEGATIFAGLAVKLIFRSRLVFIIHDTDFYDHGLRESSLPMRIYYRIFIHCLRYVDRIVVVSRATMRALSRFCPDPSRFILLWGDQ